jgi:hypothetical protein
MSWVSNTEAAMNLHPTYPLRRAPQIVVLAVNGRNHARGVSGAKTKPSILASCRGSALKPVITSLGEVLQQARNPFRWVLEIVIHRNNNKSS